MKAELNNYLQTRPDLLEFLREQPYWYRLLSRDPQKMKEMEKQAKVYHGQTFSQKVGKINENIEMAYMLINMLLTK